MRMDSFVVQLTSLPLVPHIELKLDDLYRAELKGVFTRATRLGDQRGEIETGDGESVTITSKQGL